LPWTQIVGKIVKGNPGPVSAASCFHHALELFDSSQNHNLLENVKIPLPEAVIHDSRGRGIDPTVRCSKEVVLDGYKNAHLVFSPGNTEVKRPSISRAYGN
jgi:hypothetical protein